MIRAWKISFAIALSVLLGACASAPCKDCHTKQTAATPPEPALACGDQMDLNSANQLADTVARKKTQTVDLLLLSGGGSRGSFSSGILSGWGEDRPQFELVTGISVGAILATWAYLGPQDGGVDDPYVLMEKAFGGSMDSSKIVKRRWLFPLVDSIYSLAPMKKTFREVLPTEMILKVGRTYRDTGRQLWIGTTNLESGQFCEWNLGKRALEAVEISENTSIDDDTKASQIASIVEHYYDLVIASSANPTVFQSVEINGQTHVDGGVSHTIFTTRLAEIIEAVIAKKPELKDREFNTFAIVNGRLNTAQRCPSSNVVGLAMRSITILSKSAERANLDRIKVMVDEALGRNTWNYRVAWLPGDMHLDPADIFTHRGMRELNEYGKNWISNGGQWCDGEPRSTVEPTDYCFLPSTYGKACD